MCQRENYTVLRKRWCEIYESKGAKPFSNGCPYERKVKAGDLLGSELAWCESQFMVVTAVRHGREFCKWHEANSSLQSRACSSADCCECWPSKLILALFHPSEPTCIPRDQIPGKSTPWRNSASDFQKTVSYANNIFERHLMRFYFAAQFFSQTLVIWNGKLPSSGSAILEW